VFVAGGLIKCSSDGPNREERSFDVVDDCVSGVGIVVGIVCAVCAGEAEGCAADDSGTDGGPVAAVFAVKKRGIGIFCGDGELVKAGAA